MLATPDQQISLTDPNSRVASGRGSGVVGYNVQAVDTAHHLNITHEVTNVGTGHSSRLWWPKSQGVGYSLDNLSLMAVTLAVGLVVDDAIVMLENIFRHMEEGKDRKTASLEGSAEIGFTIVSIKVSLIAVFIPLLFMGGIEEIRRYRHRRSCAVRADRFDAIADDGVTGPEKPQKNRHNCIYDASERGFEAIVRGY